MADFEVAYGITREHEGGYVNDPDDAGGETYKGIARRFHGEWKGWEIIDAEKNNGMNSLGDRLDCNDALDSLVHTLYKTKFWNVFDLDNISHQKIANEIFDTGVNFGVSRITRFLQRALNVLNRNEKDYKNIMVDGKIGGGTRKALSEHFQVRDGKLLFKVLNIIQGARYIQNMEEDETQEKYLGWFNRVEFE